MEERYYSGKSWSVTSKGMVFSEAHFGSHSSWGTKNDVIPSLWRMRGTESPQSHKGWSRGAGPAEQTEHLLAGVGEHLCDVST